MASAATSAAVHTGPRTRSMVEEYVTPLVDEGADTLVLGCTHYPFLAPLIEEIAGLGVAIVDPAVAAARELRRRLNAAGLLSATCEPGSERFWTTGAVETVGPIVARLWGRSVDVKSL